MAMMRDSFAISKKFILSFLSVACIVAFSHVALADDEVEGCDPRVMDGLNAAAETKVAYDVAVTEQIMNKPNSVLEMTCFNQSAGVAAKAGGAIFSGDFTNEVKPVVEPVLQNHYQNFASGTIGGIGGNGTQMTDTFNCQEMDKMWKSSENRGIEKGAPYATFDNLVNGTPPVGAGSDFMASWNASKQKGTFGRLKTAMDKLPQPNIPDFSNTNSSCDVLKTAGIVSSCE